MGGGAAGAYKAPELIDDNPGWVVAGEPVLDEDGQDRKARDKSPCAELQNAAIVAAGALWSHHQHWEAGIIHPAAKQVTSLPSLVLCIMSSQGHHHLRRSNRRAPVRIPQSMGAIVSMRKGASFTLQPGTSDTAMSCHITS